MPRESTGRMQRESADRAEGRGRQEPGAFYLDLASPRCHLVAERILQALPEPVEWVPVLARELPGGDPLGLGEPDSEERADRLAALERDARGLGLQELRWPRRMPIESEPGMLAGTYAREIGRAVPFLQAAFRQAYAGGRSGGIPISEREHILIAGAACEMHPRALARAIDSPRTAAQLGQATARAASLGVSCVPSIRLGDELFSGARALEKAAAAGEARAPNAGVSG